VNDTVSVVIVSHSQDIAKGTADMVRQMVGSEVKVAFCGGNPDGGRGVFAGRLDLDHAAVRRPQRHDFGDAFRVDPFGGIRCADQNLGVKFLSELGQLDRGPRVHPGSVDQPDATGNDLAVWL